MYEYDKLLDVTNRNLRWCLYNRCKFTFDIKTTNINFWPIFLYFSSKFTYVSALTDVNFGFFLNWIG